MRTGKAKQYYLQNEVIALIKKRTKELKKKSQSAFTNSVFLLLLEVDAPDISPDRKETIQKFVDLIR
jgi:hypothetical protein